ncbi:hypothetical protein CONPUDRAFT_151735 [Coniophora puteana RWD-64-598 SS2]|uniref:SWIM-type domain-containing protein n=1 Tax=Coniophora puteana (strain RWD-64-598) TaxID=741705 RepID=A0A5M3MU77_CONPW|nr:uncharacterized protein CONPUDRAFT_151735 [Coniophora puteana RWD-64-598 SS2]EIW82673.1 hypothetical protein CONPUDRAFT_151735 [Coniophora puteana RWD-64-598 SS2]
MITKQWLSLRAARALLLDSIHVLFQDFSRGRLGLLSTRNMPAAGESTSIPQVAQALIETFNTDECKTLNFARALKAFVEESVQALRGIFPDTTIVAALDLVDRESVIKYITPWSRAHYQVNGTSATYAVFLSLPNHHSTYVRASANVLPTVSPSPSHYCTCPAFAFMVLMAESHVMCKHVLAALLAERLGHLAERPINGDQLATMMMERAVIA